MSVKQSSDQLIQSKTKGRRKKIVPAYAKNGEHSVEEYLATLESVKHFLSCVSYEPTDTESRMVMTYPNGKIVSTRISDEEVPIIIPLKQLVQKRLEELTGLENLKHIHPQTAVWERIFWRGVYEHHKPLNIFRYAEMLERCTFTNALLQMPNLLNSAPTTVAFTQG